MKERFTRSWFIKKIRKEAMLDAVHQGLKSGDELKSAANTAERAITDRKGNSSVIRFIAACKKIPQIENIFKPTETEDKEWHTDIWVKLRNPVEGHHLFAVEIKSSDEEVLFVKNSRDFKKYHSFNLIINSRQGRTHNEIIKSFNSELERVAQNLRKLSSH